MMKTPKEQVLSLQALSDKQILNEKDDEGTSYLKHLFSVYKHYFDVACQSCPSKFNSYITQIKQLTMEQLDKETSAFKLKEGVVISKLGYYERYSNANLTDGFALEYLSENPNRISLFEVFPENWNQMLEEVQEVKTKSEAIQETEVQEDENKQVKAKSTSKKKPNKPK